MKKLILALVCAACAWSAQAQKYIVDPVPPVSDTLSVGILIRQEKIVEADRPLKLVKGTMITTRDSLFRGIYVRLDTDSGTYAVPAKHLMFASDNAPEVEEIIPRKITHQESFSWSVDRHGSLGHWLYSATIPWILLILLILCPICSRMVQKYGGFKLTLLNTAITSILMLGTLAYLFTMRSDGVWWANIEVVGFWQSLLFTLLIEIATIALIADGIYALIVINKSKLTGVWKWICFAAVMSGFPWAVVALICISIYLSFAILCYLMLPLALAAGAFFLLGGRFKTRKGATGIEKPTEPKPQEDTETAENDTTTQP